MTPLENQNPSRLDPESKAIPILFSGLIGGIAAALSDSMQKGEASAILKTANIVETTLQISFPPIYSLCLLLALSVALCFIFEPKTRRNAFYVGASILSIIMTLVPYEAPPSLNTNSTGPGGEPAVNGSVRYEFFGPALAYAQPAGETRIGGSAERATRVKVQISLQTAAQTPISNATVTIQDRKTRKIIARSKFYRKDFEFYQRPGTYKMIIEVPGFTIVSEELILKRGQDKSLNFDLTPARLPIFFQRLLKY